MNREIFMKHSILRKNSRSSKVYVILLILLSSSACSERSMIDLEEYVAKIKARENPHVDAIPEIKHIPPYFYEVQHMRDPFIPLIDTQRQRDITLTIENSSTKEGCPQLEDATRVRVGLELIPLDALQMVGTLNINSILWGLVVSKSEGTIYRVKQGDYLGENYGKIISISEDEIEVEEQVPDKEGCWTIQQAMIRLVGS